jgi:hypothetical protein
VLGWWTWIDTACLATLVTVVSTVDVCEDQVILRLVIIVDVDLDFGFLVLFSWLFGLQDCEITSRGASYETNRLFGQIDQ